MINKRKVIDQLYYKIVIENPSEYKIIAIKLVVQL